MHKLLVRTELPTLRSLGYEVFNPPYLSNVKDQSAELVWAPSDSTLPADVHAKLARYNFFYNQIHPEIGEILREYFDAVIVTINPDWLRSMLGVFDKTVIYRTYGQPGTVSSSLLSNGGFGLIQERDNFWFVPHCLETTVNEQAWLLRRMQIAPYWLDDDVLSFRGQWRHRRPKRPEIGLTCPNISNPYYNAHFKYLKEHFEERLFRYYGVQLEENPDANVVGTLSRERYINEFLSLSGYLYTYREPNVCYLPPVEMMVLGGPVLYLPGSLLHRYFEAASPGLARNEHEARRKVRLLLRSESGLADEIVASQERIVERYSKSHGEPIFSQIISGILGTPHESGQGPAPAWVYSDAAHKGTRPVLLYGHIRGAYTFSNQEFGTVHGIPRVMRQIVRVLTALNIPVVVTAWSDDIVNTHGFYSSTCDNPSLVTVLPVDDPLVVSPGPLRKRLSSIVGRFPKLRHMRELYARNPSGMTRLQRAPFALYRRLLRLHARLRAVGARARAKGREFASALKRGKAQPATPATAESEKWRYVIIPHYYLFPEALSAGYKRILAYIPDYIPHFFKGRDYFPDEFAHVALGRRLVGISTLVLTNSRFTAGYLPQSALSVPANKIIAFPMPFLSVEAAGSPAKFDYQVEVELAGKNFIFYPTQPHRHKRLDLLIRSWRLATTSHPELDLQLVLTSGDVDDGLKAIIREQGLSEAIHFFPGINDQTLSWLYKNALCLTITSELEGNFPTQILEALHYRCPIVAMDNPLIMSELGALADSLCIAPFADIEAFADLVDFVARNRESVLARQEDVLSFVKVNNAFHTFHKNVLDLDQRLLQGDPAAPHPSSPAVK
jgi:glycosyltransferase involved in cell wall biosynthesis